MKKPRAVSRDSELQRERWRRGAQFFIPQPMGLSPRIRSLTWSALCVIGLSAPAAPAAVAAPLLLPDGSTLELDTITEPTLRSAIYSFVESYPDTLGPAAADYGTVAQFERLYPDSVWDRWMIDGLTNEDGSLAWRRSRDMMALVEMYETTRDPRYLDRLWRFANHVLDARDDRRQLANFRGKIAPAWGASVYGNIPRRAVFLVHSGMILEPIFQLLLLLREAEADSLDDTREAIVIAGATPEARRRMLWACLESLEYFEPVYREGPREDEGHYVSEDEERERERLPEPYNRQNVMALNFWAAHRLTDDPGYADRAERLARFFQRRLERREGDFYLWDYEPPMTERGIHARQPGEAAVICDDISHAYYAIEPLPRLVEGGVVFTEEDLARFARTLTRSFHWGHGVFFTTIGCGPNFTPRIMRNLPGWLCVADADPELRPLVEGFMRRNVAEPEPLHLAYLIRAD